MMIALLVTSFLLQEEARVEWEGFAEGTSVTRRITASDGEKQESSVERCTIVKVTSDSVTVKVEMPGRSKEEKFDLKKDSGLKKTGTENVDIDGKTFACSVYEKTVEEKGARGTLRVWMHKDIPGRIAKREMVTKTDKGETKSSGKITQLNQRRQIGGKAITYAVFEFSGKTEDGRERTTVQWISEQVPGFLVREEMRGRREGANREATLITELIDFEVK